MRLAALALAALFTSTAANAATFERIASFSSAVGNRPYGTPTFGQDGFIYGATLIGGSFNQGTIYRASLFGAIETLHEFNGSDGRIPITQFLTIGDGRIFGTTRAGGDHDRGTIFQINTDRSFQSLHSFSGIDGSLAGSIVMGPGGELFGWTYQGGAYDKGTIFKFSNGSVQTIHEFDGQNGSLVTSVKVRNDGTIFGITQAGGDHDLGTVFRADGNGIEVIHHFDGGEFGRNPIDLELANDGSIIGAARGLGTGSIFRIGADGVIENLYVMSEPDGLQISDVILDADANVFGVAEFGGVSNGGTVFRLSNTGLFERLYAFNFASGFWTFGGLIVDESGSLYGAASRGGAFDRGTIFRIAGAGYVAALPAIPEPGTWAMMIAGFGLVGAGLRVRRRREMAPGRNVARAI